jgi:hypothetical protein
VIFLGREKMIATPPQKISGATGNAVDPTQTCVTEPKVRLIVMINDNDDITGTHAGLMIDFGKEAVLYDPGGSYRGIMYRWNPSYPQPWQRWPHRNTNGIYSVNLDEYPDGAKEVVNKDGTIDDVIVFSWKEYIAYQRKDGPNVYGCEYWIPQSHAERIKELINQFGGQSGGLCAYITSQLLQKSGGIFHGLPISRTPPGLGSDLKKIPTVTIINY